MAELSELTSTDVVDRVNDVLQNCTRFGGVARLLAEWAQKGWEPLLFGGFIRDIVLHGENANPRDIDVVFGTRENVPALEAANHENFRRNSFGGAHFKARSWSIDAWSLKSTWAFVHSSHLTASRENLPKTTFLNIEAIALQCDSSGRVSDVYEAGFLQSVRTKVLQINLEENPYPALSAMRALVFADKLNFALSRNLASYIVRECQKYGVDVLIETQRKHYGHIFMDQNVLMQTRSYLTHMLRDEARETISLGEMKGPKLNYQNSLWE